MMAGAATGLDIQTVILDGTAPINMTHRISTILTLWMTPQAIGEINTGTAVKIRSMAQ